MNKYARVTLGVAWLIILDAIFVYAYVGPWIVGD